MFLLFHVIVNQKVLGTKSSKSCLARLSGKDYGRSAASERQERICSSSATLSSLKSNSFWCAALHSQPPATQGARCARVSVVVMRQQACTQHALQRSWVPRVQTVWSLCRTACTGVPVNTRLACAVGLSPRPPVLFSLLTPPPPPLLPSDKTHTALVPVGLLEQRTLSKGRNSEELMSKLIMTDDKAGVMEVCRCISSADNTLCL